MGCSNDDVLSDAPEPSAPGGQTGSLVPACEVAPLSAVGHAVPVGDVLSVLQGDGCLSALSREGGPRVTGPDGVELSVYLETLDSSRGIVALRTEGPLEPGEYTLEAPLGDQPESRRQLTVGEVSAPPGELGQLSANPPPPCAPPSFELVLSEAMLAYAPLLSLRARMDGGDFVVWANYGALSFTNEYDNETPGRATLRLPEEDWGLLEAGEHTLEVTGQVAGEQTETEPLIVDFAFDCPADESCAFGRVAFGQGSLGRGASHQPPLWPGPLWAAPWFVALAWRRSNSSRRGPRQRG